jgi:hypothetical protein
VIQIIRARTVVWYRDSLRGSRVVGSCRSSMGQGSSRIRLTKEDANFLKNNTRYSEDTIQVEE